MRRPDLSDVLLILGLLIIPTGVALWSIPLAIVVAGVECILMALTWRRYGTLG